MVRLLDNVNEVRVVQISVWVVAADFEDFGDEAEPWSAFNLYDDVYGIPNVGLNGAVR